MKKITLIIFIFFMIITNFTQLREELPRAYPHLYSADKGKFKQQEPSSLKTRDPIGSVKADFERYKIKTNQPNLILYRCYKRQWWQIWNWYDFLSNPYWGFPYIEKDEVM